MVYSLTDKLSFDENPKIKIKDKTVTVKAEAETALKLMDMLETEGEMKASLKAPELLFSEKDRKIISGFKLSMKDYSTLLSVAMSLCLGQDPDEESGE
ncbi:MAG: hypothetical protein IIY21_02860 [Clostridiales bacterium]|nr:hypothetical protein [Clostridiales bacterium]